MNTLSWLLIAGILVGYILLKNLVEASTKRIGKERNIPVKRINYVSAILKFLITIASLICVLVVIGINQEDVGLFLGSMFGIIGVAFFAQWSILSNLTASVIVFFFFPYRVGDTIHIIDDKNSLTGIIKEISLFHVILINEDNETITFPNAMVFQKAIKINPKPQSKLPEETTSND